MYALPNKTQSKLIAKVRGSQNSDYLGSTNLTTISIPENFNNSNNNSKRDFSQFKSSNSFKSTSATLFKKDSLSTSSARAANNNIDEVGFNAELNNCLPQPVFQHVSNNIGINNSKKQKNNVNSSPSLNPFSKQSSHYQRNQKQNITPEHNEMIKYVQQSWKGVERDYKKSVNNYINNIDIKSSSNLSSKQKQNQQHKLEQGNKNKSASTSTPLLLSGSYHHTSMNKNLTGNNRQDTFRPFDLETFWGNRIFKRLTEDL